MVDCAAWRGARTKRDRPRPLPPLLGASRHGKMPRNFPVIQRSSWQPPARRSMASLLAIFLRKARHEVAARLSLMAATAYWLFLRWRKASCHIDTHALCFFLLAHSLDRPLEPLGKAHVHLHGCVHGLKPSMQIRGGPPSHLVSALVILVGVPHDPQHVNRAMAFGTARPAVHHREPARRCQQYRHRCGRERSR
jgi:hypothetical protein